MRKNLGALISLNIRIALTVYPRHGREQWQFFPVDCETIEHAAITLADLKCGQAQHIALNIAAHLRVQG